ncbi:MAG: hypothetical protein IJE72_01835, partial [Clostridia bacterium]|nr:hypothetical protein [Clostridia bacterium]
NTSSSVDVGIAPYQLTSDEWMYSYYVTVKDSVEVGTTISVTSPDVIWQSYMMNATSHDSRKRAYIPCAHITAAGITDTSKCKTMFSQMNSGALDYFINELEHTFIVGKPAEAKKYNVEFLEADGSTKIGEAAEYAEGASAAFPAAAENQIAWAVVKEGMETPGTLIEPAEDGSYSYTVKAMDVAFMRVLADSKYNVEVSLGTDITVDETKLPEGVSYDAAKGALVIALPVGGSFDLSTIPSDAFSKKDNTFVEWDLTGVTGASTVEGSVITLGNVNGAAGTTVTAKIAAKWEVATYNIRFFSSKEAYENGEAPVIEATIPAGGEYDTKKNVTDALNSMKKFAGWYAAETDALATGNYKLTKYSYSKDMDFYAAWTDYANLATFMVRDYENGEGWTAVYTDKADGESKTINKTVLNNIKNNAVNALGAKFVQLVDMDPDLIPEGETLRDHIAVPVDGTGSFVNDLVYSGNKVYYIATTMDYTVTWKIPVYDAEAGEFTEEYTEYPATVSTAYTPSNGIDAYFAVAKFSEKITNPTGWEITGWIDDATGEAAVFNDKGMYELRGIENKTASLTAVYSLIEYNVAFNLNNSDSPDVVTMVGTVTLGDSIEIDGAEFTFKGEASALPEIGVENSEQPDGGYILPSGYVFKGWTVGSGSNKANAEFPMTLTATMINTSLVNGAIQFSGEWEAKEFNLKFYIINAAGEEELYSEHTVKVGENLTDYKSVSDEAYAEINANAPEGKIFSKIWINKETGTSDSNTKMPAKDLVYVASYVSQTVKVYIDYNHLETPDLTQSMEEFKKAALIYGQDITEVKSGDPYYERSFETLVKRSLITTRPEASEIVAWNIYHVDAGADPYTAEWKSGVNDAGTNLAATTLIFQPVWKAHKDMFFRAYDTADNIYLALGKDFKLHYWNTGVIVDKYSETQYNTDPENKIVLFFTIDIDWENLTMSFEAFPISKSVFTIEGMLGIFEMLKNLIGSLL